LIDKNQLHELVKVFYQQPFRIFYVNSMDGETFVKPTGLFISLGLTTSMKTIEGLKTAIHNTYPERNLQIVELRSKCLFDDQYLNTITENDNPSPYVISDFPENSLGKEEAEEELKKLREQIKETRDMNLMTMTQKLQELIDRLSLSDNWDCHRILRLDSDYKIFHTIANYKKEGEFEYRIGIYVE